VRSIPTWLGPHRDLRPLQAQLTTLGLSSLGRAESQVLEAAIRALHDILTRMQAHQRKKTAMLRHLMLADRFLGESA
jgi:hypothetical protein